MNSAREKPVTANGGRPAGAWAGRPCTRAGSAEEACSGVRTAVSGESMLMPQATPRRRPQSQAVRDRWTGLRAAIERACGSTVLLGLVACRTPLGGGVVASDIFTPARLAEGLHESDGAARAREMIIANLRQAESTYGGSDKCD